MLILSRKTGEWIRIGDNIRICVVSIGTGKTRLGFDAPRDVEIHREEIYQSIQKNGKHQK